MSLAADLPAQDKVDVVPDLWLDPEFEGKEKLLSLLRPYPADEMKAYPISTLVNSPKNDIAACIEASA
jgi:putative SOS response-associated peptidase YedK